MKAGLVELFVDLQGIRAESSIDAVQQGIRKDQRREETIRRSLETAHRCGCEFVLLPGWTVEASKPPSWLLKSSVGRTIVFECLLPLKDPKATGDKDWQTFVAKNGKLVVGPAQQQVAQAGELWERENLSEKGLALMHDLHAKGPIGRRDAFNVGDGLLLICGEANFVAGGGNGSKCRNYKCVIEAGLSESNLAGVKVIANPSHTRSGPQALRDKRAWLSRNGLLLHTANIHSGYEKKTDNGIVQGKASYQAAIAWIKGERLDLRRESAEKEFVLKTVQSNPLK